MSGVLGIVADYNPFHNGHLLHLNQSKKATNCNFTICVMTGNFTQRGEPSIVDKWAKTKMALASGVDLVIELPVHYAISSAENFADGAVKILNSLGIVDYLSFGSESGDVQLLDSIADILHKNPREFSSLLNHELKKGSSYPAARENALLMYLGDTRKYANVISAPNNILGIEYMKALKKYKSKIIPVSIKRKDAEFNSLTVHTGIASATAIRELIRTNQKINTVVPDTTSKVLAKEIRSKHFVMSLDKYEKEIIYTLRRLSLQEIANLPDVTEGLENRIKGAANTCNTLAELMEKVKTKRYTATRIQRILLYALLNIRKEDMEIAKKNVPYVRVLGFNTVGKELISRIAEKNPKLKIIVSVKRFMESGKDIPLKLMLEKDIFAGNIYTLAYKKDSQSYLDYTTGVVELK